MGQIRSTNTARHVTNVVFGGLVQAPMTRREAWHMIEPVRCALQRLLDGVPNADDVGILGMAFNHGYLRASSMVDRNDDVAAMELASHVLNALEAHPLDENGKQLLKEAINRWDQLLRMSSLRQWAGVERELLAIVGEAMAGAARAAA
jgi:hypothetical protein